MPAHPHDRVRTILTSGDFDEFIGMDEDLFLEVKGSVPYDLNIASGRFELAKDVSAFANSDGGHLLIGFVHERLTSQRVDKIKALQTFSPGALDFGQIVGVVNHYVWPRIQGLTCQWDPTKSDKKLGIVSVYIPPQLEEDKFFLITKVVEAGEPQKEIVVGIARRIGSDNVPLLPSEVYDLIRKGRDPVLQRTIRIEEKIDALLSGRTSPTVPRVDYTTVLEERLRKMRKG